MSDAPNEHLDLDTLADVLAGVTAPEHLDTCGSCRARLAELAAAMPSVSAALSSLPSPPQPPDLEDRLLTAVAAARREAGSPGGDVLPLDARRPRRRLVWGVAAGAAAAAVLAAGGLLLAHRDSGTTSTQASRARWNVSSTGVDYGAGTPTLDKQLPALLAGTAAAERAPAPSPAPPSADGLGSAGTPARTTTGFAQRADSLARLRTTEGLASCLSALSDPSQPGLPLALDYARYKDQPALVVVLPANKPDKVDVFVVGAACEQADAKLLFFARLPKP